MSVLHRLLEILDAKADSITHGRRGSSDEFAQREVASFWLLHAIHASAPTLRHYLQAKRIHPERLYVELARLAGALCTFSLDTHPRALPAYDHDHPEPCFDALDRHIRAHLDIAAPTGPTAIAFTQSRGESLHGRRPRRALVRPGAMDPRRPLVAPAERARGARPGLTKVCSNKFVLELVKRAFPGLKLDHQPYPPPAISPRSDTQYFAIERSGPCWDTIVSTQEVGVYVPDSIPNVELELAIVVDAES